MITRRSFFTGLAAALAAPAVVKAEILMPVKPVIWLPKWTIPADTSVSEVGNGWLHVVTYHREGIATIRRKNGVIGYTASAYIKPSDPDMDCIPRLMPDGRADFSHLNGGRGLSIQEPQSYSVHSLQVEADRTTPYIKAFDATINRT